MSARTPIGAANRADLFGRGQVEEEKGFAEEATPINDDGPLQLEHMVGYSGEYRGTVQFLPNNESIYVMR